MRHKYETRGIVLARTPIGEMTALLTLLTSDLGLVRARAQSLRRSGARLSASLATFAESDLVLVKGYEQWRVAGAVLAENWFQRLPSASARERVARVAGLLLRLVADEVRDVELYPIVINFFTALATLPESAHDAVEVLAALYVLHTLGLDAGELPGVSGDFSLETMIIVARARAVYVERINHGIAVSGL